MKALEDKIQALKEGTKFIIPLISSSGNLYRVTENAIQLNCVNNGFLWIPKSQIIDIDESNGEIQLSLWLEKKLNQKSRTSSGAY